MICARCGHRFDTQVDYCPKCGANVFSQMNTQRFDDELETEVLVEDYQAFQDTIVDPGTGLFDPSVLSAQGASAQASGAGAQSSSSASTSAVTAEMRYATLELNAHSPSRAEATASFSSASNTRVENTGAMPNGAPPAGFGASSGSGRVQPRLVSTLPAPDGLAAAPGRQSKAFIIAIVAAGFVAIAALVVCLVFSLGPRMGRSAASAPVAPENNGAIAVASDSSRSAEKKDAAEKDLYGGIGGDDDGGEGEDGDGDAATIEDDDYDTGGGGGTNLGIGGGGGGSALGNTPAPKGRLTESDVYEILTQAYDKAGDFDKSIASCATDFNNTYLSKDKSKRSSNESSASRLRQKISDKQSELESMVLPPLCRNTSAYDDLLTCYDYLYERIDVIEEAWGISLKYDDPTKHKDEIMKPIKAEQDADGNNKYYNKFRKLYPSISIVKP